MKLWLTAVLLFCTAGSGLAQQDEAAKANDLYQSGKRLDALPLYEDLSKAYPEEWLYAERLADCLHAKVLQTDDPAEAKALRIRVRDTAKQAVALGDPHVFMQDMANSDPEAPVTIAPASPASALMQDAEKAFTAGDFSTAMAKYTEAANLDPKLYEARVFAGDTAIRQSDLKAAAKWFAQPIAVNPNRELAYRYWGDAIMKLSNDRMAAKGKFVDAVVAEPYSKYAWQRLRQWSQTAKATLVAPKIDRPAAPSTDPAKPNNITINIDPTATDEKTHPGASAWMMYSIVRAGYRGDEFKKNFPEEKEYRHSLKEEDAALALVAENVAEKKIKPGKLDDSLRNLVELNQAGMLDCWILISAADRGIAQDYDGYRKEHSQLLHDYLDRFVVHGGVNSGQ